MIVAEGICSCHWELTSFDRMGVLLPTSVVLKVLEETSTGMTPSSSPSSYVAWVQCSFMRIYDGRYLSSTMGSSPIGGSSGFKMMSTISPHAPLVILGSVWTFCVTMTFMPMAILILSRRLCHFFFLLSISYRLEHTQFATP